MSNLAEWVDNKSEIPNDFKHRPMGMVGPAGQRFTRVIKRLAELPGFKTTVESHQLLGRGV